MKKYVVFFSLVGVILSGAAQSNKNREKPVDIITHEVKRGETIRMLSMKYHATPADIYYLNKFALTGLTEGMVLHIPVPQKEVKYTEQEPEVVAEQPPTEEQGIADPSAQMEVGSQNPVATGESEQYKVQAHETLFTIAKKHNVTVDEIKQANPKLAKKGLQSGMVIKIPASHPSSENAITTGN